MFKLPEEQTGETLEPAKNNALSGIGVIGENVTFT
jgi:hypothetical protein